MKKGFSIAFVIGSAIIILSTFNVASALMMFLLLGLIPGTETVISPALMLEIISLLIGFTLARIINVGLVKLMAKRPRAYLAHA